MNRRDLLLFLALELFAIVWAGTMFGVLSNKLLAGALAGGYFVGSGLFMLYRAVKWPRRWTSFTWYILMIHVFVISLPMLLTRMAHHDRDFNEVYILGLRGPMFHQVSTLVFTLLIVATATDWLRETWATRKGATH